MRKTGLLIWSLLVLMLLNYWVYQKELLKSAGTVVYLELGTLDPRSLMQGDYMRLAYRLEEQELEQGWGDEQRKNLILLLDKNRIGRSVRIHRGEHLGPHELLLRYRLRGGRIDIKPDSFMFQEGLAQDYGRARYGEFRVDRSGNALLAGLSDDKLTAIRPR